MSIAEHEYLAFEEARAIARRRRVRILFPLAVVVIMLVALAGIAIHDYQVMRRDTLKLSEGVIDNLQRRIETEVGAYLKTIPGVVRLTRDLLREEPLKGLRRDLAEPLGISVLDNAKSLAALLIATPQGDFFMVRRVADPDGSETKIIRRPQGGEPQMTLTRHAADGSELSDRSLPWDGYDPRTRPWFKGATDPGRVFWTDVYPFFTDRSAGVTGSLPLLDPAGQTRAIIGVDLTLASLSRFLSSLSIGRSGVALIVDDQGRIVAHPDADLVREAADGSLRLAGVGDLGDAVIQRAFDRYRVEGHGRRDFTLDGRRYISAISSLNHLLISNWSILVVVPEEDFVGFVAENVRQTLWMGLGVIALAALLAAVLIRQGLKADQAALEVLARESELDRQGLALQTLSSQVVQLAGMQEAGLGRLTEAVAGASRVRRASFWQFSDGHDQLICGDGYDTAAEGHTRTPRLQRNEHLALFEALEAGQTLAVLDAASDQRTATLYAGYLSIFGCSALLAVPVRRGDAVVATLWLEDAGTRHAWSRQTESFLTAAASLLHLGVMPDEAATGSGASGASGAGAHAPSVVADYDLNAHRAEAFTERLAEAGQDVGSRIETIDRLGVMSLHFTDALALAGNISVEGDEAAVQYLVQQLETRAAEHAVGYLRVLSDHVVAAADPALSPEEGMRQLASFALELQQLCRRLFVEQQSGMAFKIGLDLGPVIGSLVGRQRRAFNLWGEASSTAAEMANTAPPGTIQCSESVYRALPGDWTFRPRGHHYLEGVGEFSTYLLSARS